MEQAFTSNVRIPPRLVDFLYILGRDHLPLGDLETIMFDFVDTEESSYCNEFLEGYARNLAKRLLDDSAPLVDWKHMHKSADGKVKWTGSPPALDFPGGPE